MRGWMSGALIAASAAAAVGARQAAPVAVVLETDKGTIELAIDVAQAPSTSANFLKYVDSGAYDKGYFHRTVRPDTESRTDYPIQVIQGSRAQGAAGFPSIALERTSVTTIKHLDGTISMARGGPDSATSDFFICIGDQPELDFGGRRNADGQGFAAFGKVTTGMDVVKKIQASPARAGTQNLEPRITILKAYRKVQK